MPVYMFTTVARQRYSDGYKATVKGRLHPIRCWQNPVSVYFGDVAGRVPRWIIFGLVNKEGLLFWWRVEERSL